MRGTIRKAWSVLGRMKGLLGLKGLAKGDWLWLKPCGAIHTVGMRFTIDVVFLDRQLRVVKVVCGVKPWRLFVWGGWVAQSALEGCSGSFKGVSAGMKLRNLRG